MGRMLIQSCNNLGILSYVMDKTPRAPCASCCTDFTLGDGLDFDAVYEFGKKVDLLTVEIENLNVDALRKLKKEGLSIHPDPDVIALVQDKATQKEFFLKNKIPSAPFTKVDKKEDIANHSDFIPGIQKLRRAGYDGRGVYKIKRKEDIQNAFDAPSILEKPIDIAKEITVIVARNTKGEMKTFPPVEMEFNDEANILDFLVAPANISNEILQKANGVALTLAKELNMVGVLAVEMFITKDGELLVNELAPRPHNSGHHTIEANITSQYEQHVRAILGFPLGSTDMMSPAIMVNLLGEKGYEGKAQVHGIDKILSVPGVYLHLYGKEITKPMRKMGHVTILNKDISKAKETAKWVKETVKIIA